MYYGANNAPSAEDPTAVWSNGFSAVWHLNESTVNGGATYDSTLNGYLGARMDTNGYGGGDAVGKIAGGDWFSSNTNHGVRTAGVPVSSNGFTVSAWVYRSGGDVPRVFENGLMPGAYSGIFDFNRCYFSIKPEGALSYVPAAVVIPGYVAGAWYYFTGVATPTQSYVYVNGNYLGASAVYTNADQIRAKWIGVYANNQSVNWFGGVDELRVENTIRSADWIKACYNNQMGFDVRTGVRAVGTNTATLDVVVTNVWREIASWGSAWDTVPSPSANGATIPGPTNAPFSFTKSWSEFSPGQHYYYRGWASNSFAVTSSDGEFYAEPNQVSGLTSVPVAGGAVTLSWTADSSSTGTVVVVRRGSVNAAPWDGSNYTASVSYGVGNFLGTSNYIVYAGFGGTNVTVSNLAYGATYEAAAFAFAGANSLIQYRTNEPALFLIWYSGTVFKIR